MFRFRLVVRNLEAWHLYPEASYAARTAANATLARLVFQHAPQLCETEQAQKVLSRAWNTRAMLLLIIL
jgi:hypothetical protein